MINSQNNSRAPSVVGTNPYGGNYDTYQKSMNNTIDTTMSSYDLAYGGQQQMQQQQQQQMQQQQGTLGSHMSPGAQQFNDLHEVHYMPGPPNTNATVHNTQMNEGFENRAYRPETRQSMMRPEETQSSQYGLNMGSAPPGYTASNTNLDKNKPTADSVLDFKRDLADQLARRETDSTNTSSTTEGTDQEYQAMEQEYQTMERERAKENGYGTSSFRPSSQYGSNTNTMQMKSNIAMHNVETIPSVPGYAAPYGHVPQQSSSRTQPNRPFDRPPEPPSQRPRSAIARSQQDLPPIPLETTFDDPPESLPPAPLPPLERGGHRMSRTKSVGEILETNFDDGSDSPLVRQSSSHSKSLHAVNDTLLESDL